MVLKDRYDLKISTSSDGARQAYVEAVDAILSATGNVENALDKCINADPNFALAYSAKARTATTGQGSLPTGVTAVVAVAQVTCSWLRLLSRSSHKEASIVRSL